MQDFASSSMLLVATPVMPNAGTYTTGKLVGGLLTLAHATRSRFSGIIQSVLLADQDKQDGAIDVIFFKSLPTGTYTDGATYSPSAADLNAIVGVVSILTTSYSDFAASSVASLKGIGLSFQLSGQSGETGTLYAALVARGSLTYANGHLQLSVGILQD